MESSSDESADESWGESVRKFLPKPLSGRKSVSSQVIVMTIVITIIIVAIIIVTIMIITIIIGTIIIVMIIIVDHARRFIISITLPSQVMISGNLKQPKKRTPKKTPSKTRKNLNPQLERLSEERSKERPKEQEKEKEQQEKEEQELDSLPVPGRRSSGRPATKVSCSSCPCSLLLAPCYKELEELIDLPAPPASAPCHSVKELEELLNLPAPLLPAPQAAGHVLPSTILAAIADSGGASGASRGDTSPLPSPRC